jgi:hypothetical protein
MAKGAASGPPAERVALYDALVATRPDLERKGAAIPYTSVNGRMVSFLDKDGHLVLRLSPEERDALIKAGKGKLHEAYGVVQQDFVEVADAVLAKRAAAKKYFDAAHAYAATLKPKPTTKNSGATRK